MAKKRKSRARTQPPRIVKKRASRIAVRRVKRARAPRRLVPVRSKRAKRQRANRRAGQIKRHARKAGAITKATKATRRTPADLTVASVGSRGADPLNVQVSTKFKLPPGKRPSANLIKEAIRFRIEHGHDAVGVTTSIVRWRNPDRKDPSKRGWREGDQEAAWRTLAKPLHAWASA